MFKKIKIIIVTVLILIVFFFILSYNLTLRQLRHENNNLTLENCVPKIEDRIVRGNSLVGLIEPGQTVKILFGFYNCNEIKRGDVAAYNYTGNSEPIIKIIKGLPADEFHLQETIGGWHILIDAEILKNSQNQPYILNENGYKMLSLYEKDYGGIIPRDAYLILGNAANGTFDSTVFGFISKNDILGKVLY